jgi:hypothetical protein
MGLTQPPIHRVPRFLSPGIKWPGSGTLSSIKVKVALLHASSWHVQGQIYLYLKLKIIEWRGLHNEKLHDLYSSPNIIRVIKSNRMRWAGYVACIRARRGARRVLVGRPEREREII